MKDPVQKSKYDRDRYLRHRDKYKAKAKLYRLQNPEKVRRADLRKKLKHHYGITIEEYDRMLAAQGGRCAICKQLPRGKKKEQRLHVDHDHKTNKVRALLCLRCNIHLGWMELFHDVAVEYLASHAARAVA